MITSKQRPLPAAPGGLDAASRRVIGRFCFELCWFCMIAAGPMLAGLDSATGAAASFATYCSFWALLRIVIAARRNEKAWASSLNSWDECLALVGVAMLAFYLSRILVQNA